MVDAGAGSSVGVQGSTGLAAILDDLLTFTRRYVVLSDAQAAAVALWVVHTHTFDAAEATPYLAIGSAERECGKTRLLETLELLVAKPWLTGRVTVAVLTRKIEAEQPTLLLDESDAAFKGQKEYAEALRGVLNTGYRRGGKTSVAVATGRDFTCRDLETFSPKAIAGIGRLPDTIASRSISIRLKRKAPGEEVQRWRRRIVERDVAPLRARLAKLDVYVGRLASAFPELPEELGDRAADVWEPLLAIAELAGDEWAVRARHAAVSLSAREDTEEQSVRVQLLEDVRGLFVDTERLSSASLVARLNALAESPWGEWANGKGLTQNAVARLLRDFEIRSRSIRLPDGSTPKGYLREQFLEAWRRYLPSEDATTPQPAPDAAGSRHTPSDVAVSRAAGSQGGTTDVAAVAAVADMSDEEPYAGHLDLTVNGRGPR